MTVDTEAIVLYQKPYSDTAFIVNLYSRTHGRITAFVRGNKSRGKSKRSHFQPTTWLNTRIDINDNKLSILKQSDIAQPWHDIPFNPIKSCMAIFLAEIIDHSTHEHETDPLLFDFLLQSISQLDRADKIANFHISLLLSMTQYLGFYPNLSQLDNDSYLNLEAGTLTSLPFEPENLSYEDTLLWHLFLQTDLEKAQHIALTRQQRQTLLNEILHYYQLQIPDFKAVKSLEVIQQLFD